MKRFGFALLALCALLAGCDGVGSAIDGDYDLSGREGGFVAGDGGGLSGDVSGDDPGTEPGGNSNAGRVTAGEWNDLDNWDFWGKLMTGQDFADKSSYWKFYTNNRVAVRAVDSDGKPVPGVKVSLERGSSKVWTAVTDNSGCAELWIGLFQKTENVDSSEFTLKLDGVAREEELLISGWDCPNGARVNQYTVPTAPTVKSQADIAFIVDATGSMGDEIDFLKDDLLDILRKTQAENSALTFRTSALFYRDDDGPGFGNDKYVTRYQDFTTDFTATTAFISKQQASDGGDYSEAVHTALEKSLSGLSWDKSAKTRLAFMLLDAPAHQDHKGVVESLQKSIQSFSERGIKLIPIAASGVNKNTEFMLRFFAATTGGTYVFITNDSGIGGDHIEASVGDYEVELLNELILRLIGKYTK
ncbi:MAG: VWA domain-containing protein [Bacteroidales bacterium]|nr:VWA domain-containing protein [Bacteroidales bacterium]